MEEIIIFKGGRGLGRDGVVKVSNPEPTGNVFLEVPCADKTEDGEPMPNSVCLRFAPDIAIKVGEALIRMGNGNGDQ